ncbi:hypothetical protein IWX48DRAFT_400793 [Phyllosticta citricarpa]
MLVLPVSACPLGTESISLRNLACVPNYRELEALFLVARQSVPRATPACLSPCAFPCVALGLTCVCCCCCCCSSTWTLRPRAVAPVPGGIMSLLPPSASAANAFPTMTKYSASTMECHHWTVRTRNRQKGCTCRVQHLAEVVGSLIRSCRRGIELEPT